MLTANYNDLVVDHFNHPQNLAPNRGQNGTSGEGGSVSSGVWIEFQLDLTGSTIERAHFRAYGCPHSIALASWLTQRLIGEKLDKTVKLDKQEIMSVLELPTEKMRSILIAEDALRACAQKLDRKEAC